MLIFPNSGNNNSCHLDDNDHFLLTKHSCLLTSLLQTSCYVSNQHPFVLLINTVCVVQGGPPTLLRMTFSACLSLKKTRTFMSRPSLCLPFNVCTYFQEIWNKCCGTGDHPNTILSNFLQSVMTTWPVH